MPRSVHFLRPPRALRIRLEGVCLGLLVFGLALPALRAASIDFEGRLLPVLEKKCFECHGDVEKPKGGLRLDGAASIMKGGESGPALVPGEPEKSPILARTSLGDSHEDFMPKEGEGLSALEKAFLKRWIQEGADFGGWTGTIAKAVESAPPATAPMPAPTPAAESGAPAGSQVAMVPGAAPSPGAAPQAAGTVNFERHVLPLLRTKCFDCHKAPYEEDGSMRKPKGSLRLDAARGILQGGGDGPVITRGDAKDSPLFTRTNLPAGDDDIMPPEDEGPPLTDAEKNILSTWINEGANFGGWVGNEEGFAEAMPAAPSSSGPSATDLLAQQVKGASADALRAVAESGALITQIAVGNPLLRVEYVTAESQIGNEQVGKIEALATNVTELDLSETAVTDEGLQMLGKFDKLTYLDLHGTKVTNSTIEAMKDLQHIEYLNLYGTAVDDACLPTIFKFRKLKAVYLWKTGVTKEGADKLKQGLPEAKINF